jgi:hypothetical protein
MVKVTLIKYSERNPNLKEIRNYIKFILAVKD